MRSQSLFTAIAIENFRRTMTQLYALHVKLTIRDLSANERVQRDRGVAAAADERSQRPRTFILGHVTSPNALFDLLADCAQS